MMPVIKPPSPSGIPPSLKKLRRWVPWIAGPIKANGKFDKIPIDRVSGQNMGALDPANWSSFVEAYDACQRGVAAGVGIVLSDEHPIDVNGHQFFIVALDFDKCGDKMSEIHTLWKELGKPYMEVSPSETGLRGLGYSSVPVRGGNDGLGRELYSDARFVTLTGWQARGTLVDFTSGILALDQLWFGARRTKPVSPIPIQLKYAETVPNLKIVRQALKFVSADTDYATWRDVVWSIMSTGWLGAPRICHLWSQMASHRYDAEALDKLIDQFDPSRGMGVGTLLFHAKNNGCHALPALALAQLPTTVAPAPATNSPLLTAQQLRQRPTGTYRVRNLFPAQGLASIFGQSGSGKSFIGLDLADAIAGARPSWFGFPVLPATVAYVVTEAQNSIGKRTTAIEIHTGAAPPNGLRFYLDELDLLTGAGVDALINAVQTHLGSEPVIIIDTLNQAAPGMDENSSQDMGKVIANAKRLMTATGGLVILIHHSGKDPAKGLRGHSSLHAALDTVIVVEQADAHRSWSIRKAKDDEGDISRSFELVQYTTGHDSFGPITSCAVRQSFGTKPKPKAVPRGANQKAAFAEIHRLLNTSGTAHDHGSIIAAVALVLTCDPRRAQERAKAAVDALILAGHFEMSGGVIRAI